MKLMETIVNCLVVALALMCFYILAYGAVAFVLADPGWLMTTDVIGRCFFLASPFIVGLVVLAFALMAQV